ncbi:hypothetical protein HYO65_gp126 [Tenacibaculum phage PTm1]|uniref:Uncharacterized protein n=1 Tax=Tenacibaculum phage PTm1 TaxID=2547425 RepID=A0A5S9EQS5_9CAUD|nr:hypothetical protein HYO65_gp126 [Tenacibaculum phage PTm1]BBI90518.1 hypothetical protein [Tenacibaculum phage PTm1]
MKTYILVKNKKSGLLGIFEKTTVDISNNDFEVFGEVTKDNFTIYSAYLDIDSVLGNKIKSQSYLRELCSEIEEQKNIEECHRLFKLTEKYTPLVDAIFKNVNNTDDGNYRIGLNEVDCDSKYGIRFDICVGTENTTPISFIYSVELKNGHVTKHPFYLCDDYHFEIIDGLLGINTVEPADDNFNNCIKSLIKNKNKIKDLLSSAVKEFFNG